MSIAEECESLVARCRSLMLATVDAHGEPWVSYAPFVRGSSREFYVFVSELARHTPNLRKHPTATVLIIEDEAESAQIFARRRVTFECDVDIIARNQADWDLIVDQFQETFGELIATLRSLADFSLVRFAPRTAVFVKGFGQAYRLQGTHLDQAVHLRRID